MTAKADQDNAAKIAATLRAVADFKRRQRARHLWLLAAACVMSALLLVVAIDWFVAWQSPWGRWLGPLIVLTMAGLLVARALKIQLGAPDDFAAARALDRSSDKSQERWTTVAALQPDGIGATGSDAMAAALMTETAPLCRFVDPAKVEPAPPPRRRIGVLIGASALLLIFLGVFFSQGSPRLLARFFLPWADLPLTRLAEVSPPSNPALRGDNIQVSAQVSGRRVGSVILEMIDAPQRRPEAPTPRTLSQAAPDQRDALASFTVERLRRPLRYRLRAGDATTDWRDIKLTDRPKVIEMSVTLTDPAYSSRPPRNWQPAPEQISAVRGSQLDLLIELDRDITSARLELAAGGDGEPQTRQSLDLEPLGDRRYRYRGELNTDFVFRPAVVSSDGYANQGLRFCHITITADQAPSVELSPESASEIVSLSHGLPLAFEAEDDIGVEAAEVIFTITDADGNTREVLVPLKLGDQKGQDQITLRTTAPLDELALAPGEQVSYSVRVRDGFQQSSAGAGGKAMAQNDTSSGMTKRPLGIGDPSAGESSSKSRDLRIAGREMLNEIEPKKKQLLAIETAFQQLKAMTASALRHTVAAKAPEVPRGQKQDMRPLYSAVADARGNITSATQAVGEIAGKAPGTPYEFLTLQLQNILKAHLTPADAKLEASVTSRHIELAPREAHRSLAEGHLMQAMAIFEKIEGQVAAVRSKVEAEFAMTELMDLYVAQVEDLPILMNESGGAGTPYSRSPGEVSREQAEAALKRLEARKELYQKTAELLRQHPELWQRYMDKSKSESKIYRDELEALGHRHDRVRSIGTHLEDDGAANSGAQAEIRQLIADHNSGVTAALQRTLEKARTWRPESAAEKLGIAIDGQEPAWLEPLNAALLSAFKNSSLTNSGATADDLVAASQASTQRLEAAKEALQRGTTDHGGADRSFFALRLGEISQALSEQRLATELAQALKARSWRRAALLEQAEIAHQTQALAGKIEVEGARLYALGADVKGYGETLTEIMQGQLMPPLAESVHGLMGGATGPSVIAELQGSQTDAAEAFRQSVRALDAFVMAAIREMDRQPAKASAGVAGLPKITARTLAELQEKLERENEFGESFGIPCCRPTNFQVMSDWQQFAGGSKSSGSPSGAGSSPASSASASASSSSPPKSGQKPAPAAAGSPQGPGGKPQPGQGQGQQDEDGAPSDAKRSQMDVADLSDAPAQGNSMADLARAEALRQAQDLADRASSEEGPKGDAKESRSEAGSVASASGSASASGAAAAAAASSTSGNGDDDGEGRPADTLAGGSDEWLNRPSGDRDWNRLGSELRREFLREHSEDLPESYRQAIEDYFRALSKWKTDDGAASDR